MHRTPAALASLNECAFLCLKACIVACDCGLSGRWCLCPTVCQPDITWHITQVMGVLLVDRRVPVHAVIQR